MRIKTLKLLFHFAAVLTVLCIISSGAFAVENSQRPAHGLNITEDNFADVQANILESISEQITELQNFYNNVSEASNASDLQKVLSSSRQANKCMGSHEMNMRSDERYMRPGEMHGGPGEVNGFSCLGMVENVTDENFTDAQTQIVDSLGNMTDMLEAKQANLTEDSKDDRAAELGERIADLQNFSTEVSEASTAAELQEVVLTYMKTQAVESLEKEIEFLEAKVSESENMSDENMNNELSSRITELTSLVEKINETESLADLREITLTSEKVPGAGPGVNFGDHHMKHGEYGDGGHRRFDCPFDCPRDMQDINSDNDTNNNTSESTE